jgi:hypothetical protein
MASDDPVTCADYAKQHGLLDTDGWKQFQRITTKADDTTNSRLVNQAMSYFHKREPFWKFGVLVPWTHSQTMELDHRKNGNIYWKEAEASEMKQLLEVRVQYIH